MSTVTYTPDYYIPVAAEAENTRTEFLRKTYTHLVIAIAAFVGVEWYLFTSGLAERIAQFVFGHSWLLILGGFMVLSWLGTRFGHKVQSVPQQYAGFAIVILAQSLIFCPLLYIANAHFPGAISQAAWLSIIAFTGLTAIVMITGKDFSFLRGVLMWGGLCVLGLIVVSVIAGWNLGTWFSVGMIAFAGGAILYDTSNVLHHYPKDRYVGASIELFSSLALMFWYVLRLVMGSRSD